MEKKLNPRMIEYSVEIKTKKELPKSGFDGVVVRLIGTRDSSNPIAINGMYTGKHQLFTVPLSDIGTIQKVFLNRIYDIEEHFQTFMVFLWGSPCILGYHSQMRSCDLKLDKRLTGLKFNRKELILYYLLMWLQMANKCS